MSQISPKILWTGRPTPSDRELDHGAQCAPKPCCFSDLAVKRNKGIKTLRETITNATGTGIAGNGMSETTDVNALLCWQHSQGSHRGFAFGWEGATTGSAPPAISILSMHHTQRHNAESDVGKRSQRLHASGARSNVPASTSCKKSLPGLGSDANDNAIAASITGYHQQTGPPASLASPASITYDPHTLPTPPPSPPHYVTPRSIDRKLAFSHSPFQKPEEREIPATSPGAFARTFRLVPKFGLTIYRPSVPDCLASTLSGSMPAAKYLAKWASYLVGSSSCSISMYSFTCRSARHVAKRQAKSNQRNLWACVCVCLRHAKKPPLASQPPEVRL